MMHQYDDRWATYEPDGTVRDVTLAEKRAPSFSVLPRYWVQEANVTAGFNDRWNQPWLLGRRDIARATDERTMVAPLFPRSAVGNEVPLMLARDGVLLSSVLNSFAADFVTRQSAGGTSLNYFIVKQVAVLNPQRISATKWLGEDPRTWFEVRIAEMSGTAYGGPVEAGYPFRYDPVRRLHIRSEIDAAILHIYGLTRSEVDYVMEAFLIVRKKDETAHGEYRTKRLILQAYDAMAAAIAAGTAYTSPMTPPRAKGRGTTSTVERMSRHD